MTMMVAICVEYEYSNKITIISMMIVTVSSGGGGAGGRGGGGSWTTTQCVCCPLIKEPTNRPTAMASKIGNVSVFIGLKI